MFTSSRIQTISLQLSKKRKKIGQNPDAANNTYHFTVEDFKAITFKTTLVLFIKA